MLRSFCSVNYCSNNFAFFFFSPLFFQNVMPLSAGLLRSQRRNTAPQCPPRFQVQHLSPGSWARVPDCALRVTVDRPDDCHGWRIQCSEPLQVMSLHIPNENRSKSRRAFKLLNFGFTKIDVYCVFSMFLGVLTFRSCQKPTTS